MAFLYSMGHFTFTGATAIYPHIVSHPRWPLLLLLHYDWYECLDRAVSETLMGTSTCSGHALLFVLLLRVALLSRHYRACNRWAPRAAGNSCAL